MSGGWCAGVSSDSVELMIVRAPPSRYLDEHLRHIAPIRHRHINMCGVLTFDLERPTDPGTKAATV